MAAAVDEDLPERCLGDGQEDGRCLRLARRSAVARSAVLAAGGLAVALAGGLAALAVAPSFRRRLPFVPPPPSLESEPLLQPASARARTQSRTRSERVDMSANRVRTRAGYVTPL